ncbi:two-component system, OmpR family, sensor histidine kinase TctE [Monaibacterium marinum]|uniref:histidine kinase n=1 Tax=Pontivivens marinum TaxID=1690039 RepID=A0A2C9CXI2_9RHOB|nr:sensor histidine kinase [Monaibacterium marinum]SOH95149.1 two-component system, OmpR family, sensor histidine kinase TctE [Monaibacterium marinum]
MTATKMHPTASIRQNLFYQLAGVAAILSFAFFLIVRGVAEQAAEMTQDGILSASATAIADALRSEGGAVVLDLPYSALSMLGTLNEDRVFYRIYTDQQTLTGYPDLPLPDERPRRGEPVFETHEFRGDEVRAVSVMRPVGASGAARNVIVTVAQTRLGLEATSRTITTTATGVAAGFFLAATGLSLWAASAALAPIERLTSAVARRGPYDLRPVTADTPTELVPLVDALNSFMTRLRASLSRTEDFIAEAAHRVRTPLATVRTQAEVTHRKLNKPEHRLAIREMIRAIDESSRSAGQMLDHAMVKFRTDTLASDQLDMRALIDEVCDRLGATADLKDIDIIRDLPDDPIPIHGDGILLQATLQNLLDNAIKYSPEDSRITVSVTPNDALWVSITDEGRGFGDADLTRLKTRYTRGANVGDIVGSGLGLTIADEVASAHGGRIDIKPNENGAGACVSLVLPRE